MDTPGRFGTVELLRKTGEDAVIASFGVDTPTVSFGRDPTCSVRLYYPAVAPLHARIVFNDDRKAFIEVIGSGGVVVDGCMVFPLDGPNGMRTIALGNGSEVEIHGKRFRFTYPPKDMRAVLAASPARPGNRALRLSMIASAQVSPRVHPTTPARTSACSSLLCAWARLLTLLAKTLHRVRRRQARAPRPRLRRHTKNKTMKKRARPSPSSKARTRASSRKPKTSSSSRTSS
ncbi:hypothetical protein B0H14DRAFT_458333 [Mycena olivaceomarginata]|nr:hypothetical protein B0H14DRAFT_458333 [Mycena olivaceomarginata]